MPEVAIATVSQDAADAGVRIAVGGGNAVDAAVGAALVAVVTHPGMCSLGGGGFITVWPGSGDPVALDGGHEMPGRGLPADRFGGGGTDVHFDYGNGVDTTVGPGSVATPGALAVCALAAERYGGLPWSALLEPALERARDGFPMPASSHSFLVHAHEPIYARDPRSRSALHDEEGRLLDPGETIRIPHLVESLEAIAEEGIEVFYRGELGRRVSQHVEEGGGLLTRRDLAAYRPVVRDPLESPEDGWRVATVPAPSIGGGCLAAMLRLMGGRPREAWTPEEIEHLVRTQENVLRYRTERLSTSDDPGPEMERLLKAVASGGPGGLDASASTLHTSTVDSDGTACAVTLSDGYGSGVMPPGTGFWLNNCLGENGLNPGGYHALEPGTRLLSNMAPTVARRSDGGVLAIGSPGSARIPTAILQALLNHLRLGMPLQEAVDHPRLHVETDDGGSLVVCEPGLPVEGLELPVRRFDGPSLYFGGVAAVLRRPAPAFDMGADARRTGGTGVGGAA